MLLFIRYVAVHPFWMYKKQSWLLRVITWYIIYFDCYSLANNNRIIHYFCFVCLSNYRGCRAVGQLITCTDFSIPLSHRATSKGSLVFDVGSTKPDPVIWPGNRIGPGFYTGPSLYGFLSERGEQVIKADMYGKVLPLKHKFFTVSSWFSKKI